MAWTQADLDALDKAIASGAVRVDYPNSGSITYRSLADMRSIRGEIQNELNQAAGAPKMIRRIKPYAVKDL